MKKPTITLCMMVKNEEKLLPRCLASVSGYVDEMIVVDTGSTDRTVKIAESFGCKIFHHPWEDDFSKHRNQSIGYAKGDWFLILDADEEIIEHTGVYIREAVKDSDTDSISFQIISAYAGKKKSVHIQERLFRNHMGIHYEGRIHNRIVGTKSTCIYPIKILHHGYNVSGEKGKRKHERRLRILSKEIEANPGDPTFHHYLAASYLSVPEYEQAAHEGLEAIRLAEANGQIDAPLFAWTYFITANALYHSDRTEEAKASCQKGIERFPDDLDLHYMACQIFFDQKNAPRLQSHAFKYLEIHEQMTRKPNPKRMFHCTTISLAWKIWYFMAMSHLQAGRQKDSQNALEKALTATDNQSDVYHAMGRYYMENGNLPRASRALSQAMETDPFNEDILFSQIECSIRAGDADMEIKKWQELLDRFPEKKGKMIQQTERAMDEGRLNDARKFFSALLDKYPDEAPVCRLGVQYARRNHSPDLEMQYLEQLQQMGHLQNTQIKRLGFLLFRQDRLDHADIHMRQAMESAPAEPGPYVCLAAILWRKKDMAGCIQALDQALCLMTMPCDMEISQIHELGAIFALLGGKLLEAPDAEAACMAYEAAIEMKCHLPEVHLGKARALHNAGMPEESLDYLKSHLKTAHDPLPFLRLMGDMYKRLGKSEAADLCYQKSHRIMSNPPMEPHAS
jgi:tetratricopeptide (TPR) repeat protein